MLQCPNCKTDYKCPCNSCKERFYKNNEEQLFSFVGNDKIKCNTCGLIEHDEWWFDQEYDQTLEFYNVNSLKELSEKQKNDE